MSLLLDRPQDPRVTGSRDRPPPHERSTRRRPSTDRVVLIGLLAVVLVVHGVNIAGYPALGDDEGTYLAQAWAVQEGIGLGHYTYWYDHPPVGWLQIAALSWLPALFLPEHLATANARLVILPFTLASVALLYTLGRRLELPRWSAALAAALFALSPLAVTLQRQLYLDNLAVPWMLAAFVLVLSPRRDLWHHCAAGFCAAVAVLSKETMLIVLPAVFLALWMNSHPSTRKFSIAGFLSLVALTGISYPLYAALNGELLPGEGHVSLVDGILFQLQRQGSGSFLIEGSGSRAIVESWLYYDPCVIVGGLVTTTGALIVRPLRPVAVAVILMLLMAMRSGYLPAMYVIQALPFLALCLAGVLAVLVQGVLDVGGIRYRGVRLALVSTVLLIGAALVLPGWIAGAQRAMTEDANAANREVVAHLAAMPHDENTRVMVDDAIWLDLVRAGYQPGNGAIWFYKLDLDPAVQLDNGWRDLDYVVSTPIIRESMSGLQNVNEAMTNSVPVAVFGPADAPIEIRRVVVPS